MKNILAIIGSASKNSSNLNLVKRIGELTKDSFCLTIIDNLSEFPHFDLSVDSTPEIISTFRAKVLEADGILICTPEYVFSIPSRLKNVIEWCVSTTVFSNKPLGLITASANGEKGHEELQLIIKTLEAKFNKDTTLLIQGIKGKIDSTGTITDRETATALNKFISHFEKLVSETH